MIRQLISLLALVGVSLTTLTVSAAERIKFERFGNGPPIYTRLETTGQFGFHDGGWTCIPIIRDPNNIPTNFNLLLVLDPDRARARSVELMVDGFAITKGGPAKLQHYEDREDIGVPILFVRTDELQTIDDGDIFIWELFALTHVWGVAEIYTEQVYTGWQHMISAHGFLQDGTPFIASYAHGAGTVVPKVEAHIRFGN